MKTLIRSKEQLSFDEWLAKYHPNYNYEIHRNKCGDKRANKTFANHWRQYEIYLDKK